MDRVQLRDDLVNVFSAEELQALCRRLDVTYDGLGGKTLSDKATSLVGLMARNGRLTDLIVEVIRERPHLRHAYAEYLPEPSLDESKLDWLDRLAAGEGPAIEEPPTMRWDSDSFENES